MMCNLNVRLCIATILPPSPSADTDRVVWSGEANGRFSIKSAYRIRIGDNGVNMERHWNVVHQFKKSRLGHISNGGGPRHLECVGEGMGQAQHGWSSTDY
ncbi:hypothetical protein V6N11_014251 [Hibiscus sabdariffa]|uniref:Secreted protein n=1 Tax=Hibiscus sabdariffa TaxID=183260 RepID=A0ABR1Z8Z0_9ROSI